MSETPETLQIPEAPAHGTSPRPSDPTAARPSGPVLGHEAAEARRLVLDLLSPNPLIYWADLLLSAAAGWGAFAAAVTAPPGAWRVLPAALIAAACLYRGQIFAHEISHQRSSALRGFSVAWDALVGVPLMLPSVVYLGMHKDHHRTATYGTGQDPEYLPFAGRRAEIVRFAAGSLLLPALTALRFLVAAPVGLLFPPFHRWLERHATSLTINPFYRRQMSARESRLTRAFELLLLGLWAGLIALACRGAVPWRAFGLWYGIGAAIGLVNTIRALGAHRYVSDGRPMDRTEQLDDSIDTPGGWWTELWAPVGLRYHALHHYFPGLPYHNLGTAYARLVRALPADSHYRRATSPGLPHSLRALWNYPRQLIGRRRPTATEARADQGSAAAGTGEKVERRNAA